MNINNIENNLKELSDIMDNDIEDEIIHHDIKKTCDILKTKIEHLNKLLNCLLCIDTEIDKINDNFEKIIEEEKPLCKKIINNEDNYDILECRICNKLIAKKDENYHLQSLDHESNLKTFKKKINTFINDAEKNEGVIKFTVS